MPTRLHRPPHDRPPSLRDHVLAHPWDIGVVAGVWVTLGALLCWTWIDPGGGPATVLSELNPWAAAGVSLALLVSGLGVMAAIVWPGREIVAWRCELYGLPLGLAAWASYGLATDSTIWKVIAGGYLVGGIIRLIAAWLNIRHPVAAVVIITEE